MNLILLGAPGAGKGTQAEVICSKLNIPAVSTGNLLREQIKNHTKLGTDAKEYMDKGALVPDELVIGMLAQRLLSEDCQNGFILDGFPRTVSQAEALDDMKITIDKVISLEVDDENIMKRLSGRRVCESCGASYHIEYKPSKVSGICDKCGGKTVLRSDDRPDTVKDRLVNYHNQTEPLKRHYSELGKLYTVVGQEDISETTALTIEALER